MSQRRSRLRNKLSRLEARAWPVRRESVKLQQANTFCTINRLGAYICMRKQTRLTSPASARNHVNWH